MLLLPLPLLSYFLLVSSLQLFSSPLAFGIEVESQTLQTSSLLAGKSSMVALSCTADNDSIQEQVESSSLATLVLAPRRTYRKDPLNHFTRYTGGWNITNRHYWASVGYTAAPLFVTAAAWFVIFGLCLLVACIFWCCSCLKEPYNARSPTARVLSLIFLVFFSIATIIGCVVLYTGQGKFHASTINALEYVVGKADATSNKLRNVSEYLSAAKQVNVDQVSLPPNAQTDIDQTQTKIDSSATTLADTTKDSLHHVKNLMQSMRLALIVLAAVMLLLTFLGLVFSVLGMQIPVYTLVITAWILVTGTITLCGIFLLLHNVTGDTCIAMNQWVQMNPAVAAQHTALDDVLGCVDNATVQDALSKTKLVTIQLVDVINTVISNVSNINFAPNFAPMYYNQSGPLVPSLCNPFRPDLTDRPCMPGEVDLNNATQAWSGYVCQTVPSPSGNNNNDVCITSGRLTPRLYSQMAAAVNVSSGLYQYGPIMAELEDCSFVRQTFSDIDAIYCPTLRKYSHRIYVGLAMVATAVMLSLFFWVIHGGSLHKLKDVHGGNGIPIEEGYDQDHKQ